MLRGLVYILSKMGSYWWFGVEEWCNMIKVLKVLFWSFVEDKLEKDKEKSGNFS